MDITQITDSLYISAWPWPRDARSLGDMNIRIILSMHWWKPSGKLNRPPLRLLWLPTIDHPLTPMPLGVLLRGVKAALPVIQSGGAALSHCRKGVHRSVAMACSILIAQGYSADDAMHLTKSRRPAADPYADYIQARIRLFEQAWLAQEMAA
ncbi:MAG: dual specificity protein phosphatase family protein [Chloroflexi bacterium]|nr:dual specificity protein phosphatase family protein [Chloroflexota bacterium]